MNSRSENLNSFFKKVFAGIKELKNLSLSRLRKVFSLLGRKEKIILLSLLAIAFISFYFSVHNFYYQHTLPAPANGGSYSEGLLGQPGYINPLLARMEPDPSLTALVFAGLYKYDQSGKLTADLAESLPTISQDQKQYTVNIKHGLKWHNGKPLTADDVVFTIQLLKDPSYKSPWRLLWQATNVEKLSDFSVKFTTKEVSEPFINNLTLPILPKAVWNNVDSQNFLLSKFNLEAVGSGPYAIKQIKKLPSGKVEEIVLESYDEYYAGPPKIDQLVFKFYDTEDDMLNAFHSREIMGFGFVPLGSSLFVDKQQPQGQILSLPLPQYQMVFFNLNNKFLSDQNVRQALNLATDKQQVVSEVFKGNALLPSSPWLVMGQNAPASKVDLGESRNLLEAGGWKIDPKINLRTNKKGTALEITISTNDSLVNSKAAEVLANQWRALNIKVNLSILPAKQLTDTVIKPRNFDVLLFPQKFAADPDPFPFWHSSQVKDPGLNLTGFSDPAADKLILEARSTTNETLRQAKHQEFNNIISSKVPAIFLDQTEYIYVLDKSVKNLGLQVIYDPSQRFNNISNWYTEERRVWK